MQCECTPHIKKLLWMLGHTSLLNIEESLLGIQVVFHNFIIPPQQQKHAHTKYVSVSLS
jgi:hypothetical protein